MYDNMIHIIHILQTQAEHVIEPFTDDNNKNMQKSIIACKYTL